MINPEQDVKWECLRCGHVWYDEYNVHHMECPECQCTNIVND